MKIALIGYGKMGKTIDQLIQQQYADKHQVVLRIDQHNIEDLTTEELAQADVAIEFSTPNTVLDNIHRCFAADIPIVVGTTAWHEQLETVVKVCQKKRQTLFYASNFSIGVNIFFALNEKLASLMKGRTNYQLLLEEIHHTQKLDAPSGTAITLAQGIMGQDETKTGWVKEKSQEIGTIPIVSYREADVKGTHRVVYESAVDTIEMTHTAHSRQGFAQGAVLAAEWVIGQKGVFTMKDLLGM